MFVAAAAALAITAWRLEPERRSAAIFSDEGEAFYPNFKDPQAVKSIEVIDYDESTATARPFKVELQKGRWVIASSENYPVDIGDRLVKTAAALLDLRKDQVRSDSAQEHARYGVVDPFDQKTASLQGRGKRVTLRDTGKMALAEYIFGKPVENKPGWRYVRVPGQKRTYAVKTDADPSARFADWVNAGLLRIPANAIRKVTILSYNINEDSGRLDNMENIVLTQEGGQWKLAGGESVKQGPARALAATLDGLKITDARPKPPSLAAGLREGKFELTLETAMSLRQRGFYLTPNGRILANEGEMVVETSDGATFHLRFGELAGSGDNRYLFVTASGEGRAKEMNARFADWYYVISGADLQKLRLRKKDLM